MLQVLPLTTSSSLYWANLGWRLLLAVIVLVIGLMIAKKITKLLRQGVRKLLNHEMVAGSPVAMLFESTKIVQGSGLFSSVVYWILFFLFIAVAGEIVGITFLSQVVAMFVSFLPMLLSALFILFLGMLVSGVVEKAVKQPLKSLFPEQATAIGTAASSVTLILFALIAMSELGIASGFILVLFIGLVATVALSVGLAVGLGAKDLVAEALTGVVQKRVQHRNQQRKS